MCCCIRRAGTNYAIVSRSGYIWIWPGARDQESTNHSSRFVEWKSTYQNRGLSHLPKPKAKADETSTRFDNSWDFSKMYHNDDDNINGPLT